MNLVGAKRGRKPSNPRLKIDHCECGDTGNQQILIDLGHKSYPKAKVAKEKLSELIRSLPNENL